MHKYATITTLFLLFVIDCSILVIMSKKSRRTDVPVRSSTTVTLNTISVKRPRSGDSSDSKSTSSIEDIEDLVNNYGKRELSYDADNLPVQHLRRSLLNWYSNCRRKLPWRGDVSIEKSDQLLAFETDEEKRDRKLRVSAYGTWISEVMCQQTRVETVISYWNRWMEVFIK